jgi:UDP-N-acetylglucosamine acyltransferase
MSGVHASALVHPGAKLGEGVTVGAYSIVGEHVEIGDGTWIGPHVVLAGHTRIGRENRIFQFSSLGEVPQDKKYSGEPTRLEIGDRNTIREFCSINIGTAQDVGITRLGNDNWIMASVHIAHDCQVGNQTIFANNATLAGHVTVEDYAILGGFAGIHQFCHIGAHSMVGISSVVTMDVPPCVTVGGNPTAPHGINAEGLKRRGFSPDVILALRRAYKTLYKSGLSLAEAKSVLEEQRELVPEVGMWLDFLAVSTRGIIR